MNVERVKAAGRVDRKSPKIKIRASLKSYLFLIKSFSIQTRAFDVFYEPLYILSLK